MIRCLFYPPVYLLALWLCCKGVYANWDSFTLIVFSFYPTTLDSPMFICTGNIEHALETAHSNWRKIPYPASICRSDYTRCQEENQPPDQSRQRGESTVHWNWAYASRAERRADSHYVELSQTLAVGVCSHRPEHWPQWHASWSWTQRISSWLYKW